MTTTDLAVGLDVGGTKVSVMNSITGSIQRYDTAAFADLDSVLDSYVRACGAVPRRFAIAMAGIRDESSGAVLLTNANWPRFDPSTVRRKFAGSTVVTLNDMVATMHGALAAEQEDLHLLKHGTAVEHGNRVVIALSTGIGVAAAVWSDELSRYVILASEAGHIGFHASDAREASYLAALQLKHTHASVEHAMSGRYGIENLVDHLLPQLDAPGLCRAVSQARAERRPVGTVLLATAGQGAGKDRVAAAVILDQLGGMIGSAIRDLVVAFTATGGVFLTGSLALSLAEYLARQTCMLDRFVRKGARHDETLRATPIHLITDEHVAVRGALSVARQTGAELRVKPRAAARAVKYPA